MIPDPLTTISGYGTLAAFGIVALIQVIKSWTERNSQTSGAVTDLATANTALQSNLSAERAENTRLSDRVTTLEHRCEQLQQALETEREAHRQELHILRTKFDALQAQLAAVEARYDKETP